MRKNRSSTFLFALAYVVFVVGVFLALGGAAYAADSPTAAADQYDSPIVEITVPPQVTPTEQPAAPTDTGSEVSDVAAPEVGEDVAAPEVEEAGPFLPPEVESEVVDVADTLPSTGLSLFATALLGGALVAFGVALRRRERRGD